MTRFLKEYPFCDKEYNNDWQEDLSGNDVRIKIKHLRPTMEYIWESGNGNHFIDETISFYLPSKTLIDELNLYYPPKQYEDWVSNSIPAFKNPSIKSKGPSYALVKTDVLNTWLDRDNLCVVWLIGGEKRLYAQDSKGKKHDFSGVYFSDNGNIKGDLWFLSISSWGR